MLKFNIPTVYDVAAEANKKGLSKYRITKGTGLSSQTVYAYFANDRVSIRSQKFIINYINNEPSK